MVGSSTRLFYITVVFILLAGGMIFMGVQEELEKRQINSPQIEASSSPFSNEEVLGEDNADATSSAGQSNTNHVLVNKVIDGDTIEITDSSGKQFRVRLIGVDTQETVDPNRPKGCFGSEASN